MNVSRFASAIAAIACIAALSACAAEQPAEVVAEPEVTHLTDVIAALPRPRPIIQATPRHKVCGPDNRLFNGKCLSRLETWHLRGTI